MRKVEKKRLDEIAKMLVKADAPSPRDIESIIANPALFDSVRARVKLTAREPVPSRFLFGRTAVASFASIALIGATAIGLLVFNTKPVDRASVPAPQIPENQGTTTKFSQPDRVAVTDIPRPQPPVRSARIAGKPDAPDVRISRPRQSAAQQIRYEGENGDFY